MGFPQPFLLYTFFRKAQGLCFRFFTKIKKSSQEACRYHQSRSQDHADTEGLVKYENADDGARNRLQRAEDGGDLPSHQEGALLKEHHGTRGNEKGKQNAHPPAKERRGQSEASRCKAKNKRCDTAAEQGYHANRGKKARFDLQRLPLPQSKKLQGDEGKKISEEDQRKRIDSIGIDMLCHEGHTAVNNGGKDGKKIAFYCLIH